MCTATEIKAQIEAFKFERIGGRKKEFVEATLQTTSVAGIAAVKGDGGDGVRMDESEG